MRIAEARGSCEGLFSKATPLPPERMMEIIDADVYAEEPER